MTPLTEAQRMMLDALRAGEYPTADLLEDIASRSTTTNYPLAWRNADRTLGALLRRGWAVMVLPEGEAIEITDAGLERLR